MASTEADERLQFGMWRADYARLRCFDPEAEGDEAPDAAFHLSEMERLSPVSDRFGCDWEPAASSDFVSLLCCQRRADPYSFRPTVSSRLRGRRREGGSSIHTL
jgi:hypothetical protein